MNFSQDYDKDFFGRIDVPMYVYPPIQKSPERYEVVCKFGMNVSSMATWTYESLSADPSELQFLERVTFRLNWTHQTIGSDPSVCSSVRPSQNEFSLAQYLLIKEVKRLGIWFKDYS